MSWLGSVCAAVVVGVIVIGAADIYVSILLVVMAVAFAAWIVGELSDREG